MLSEQEVKSEVPSMDWKLELVAVPVTDDRGAPSYDDDSYPVPVHARFVRRLVDTCPPDGVVLDGPCGTGRS